MLCIGTLSLPMYSYIMGFARLLIWVSQSKWKRLNLLLRPSWEQVWLWLLSFWNKSLMDLRLIFGQSVLFTTNLSTESTPIWEWTTMIFSKRSRKIDLIFQASTFLIRQEISLISAWLSIQRRESAGDKYMIIHLSNLSKRCSMD